MGNRQLTVIQKFEKAILELRKIHTYYSAVYESLNKKESHSIDTMGVDCDTLYYNPTYVDKLDFGEFLFVSLHEETHLMLKHTIRRERRDRLLYNIAADLYVNRILAQEFEIRVDDDIRTSYNPLYPIRMPSGALYCSSISVEKDTVEGIYDELERQAEVNGYLNYQSNKELGLGTGSDKEFQFEYVGQEKACNRNLERDKNWVYKFSITPESYHIDLLYSDADKELQEQRADEFIQGVKVRYELSEDRRSNSNTLDIGAGIDKGILKRMIDGVGKSHVNWKALIRKYLLRYNSKQSSFKQPDKRMYYQHIIYPGQYTDDYRLNGVKICIDVSRSITDFDLENFLSQESDLLNRYNVNNAEVIYWDTELQSMGNLKELKVFKKIETLGGGGTDPSILFHYFDSRKCKVKPYLTIIFTDGWFSCHKITNKQKYRYKNTIWIMTEQCNKNFKAPFGVMALAKFDK